MICCGNKIIMLWEQNNNVVGTKYISCVNKIISCGNKILYWGNNIFFSRMALIRHRSFCTCLCFLFVFCFVSFFFHFTFELPPLVNIQLAGYQKLIIARRILIHQWNMLQHWKKWFLHYIYAYYLLKL
jgi:hypothetical protein